jgi:hypothetical protein
MTEVRYYAIIGRGRAASDPSGLARRSVVGKDVIDESLRRDMSWGPTTAITEWDRGEELTRDLAEISDHEAQELIERFRVRWGGGA